MSSFKPLSAGVKLVVCVWGGCTYLSTSPQRLRSAAEDAEVGCKDAGKSFLSHQTVPGKVSISSAFYVKSSRINRPFLTAGVSQIWAFFLLQLPVLPGQLWEAAVPYQWPITQTSTTQQHTAFAANPERFPWLGKRWADRKSHSMQWPCEVCKKHPALALLFCSWDKQICFSAEKTEQPFTCIMKNKSSGNRNNKTKAQPSEITTRQTVQPTKRDPPCMYFTNS